MNKQETNKPTIMEDLSVEEGKAEEVKGGPIYVQWTEIKGDVTTKGYERE